MIDLTSRPLRKPDYRLEMIDGEILLYHLDRTQILYCNQTASMIWNLCDGKLTVTEMITLLQDAYPEAGEVVATDVQATLQTFIDSGAVFLT